MKKRLVFFSYNLGMGGIEKALVNLLNKIDYDKYEVDLYLLKKEGELLTKLNENVNLKEYKLSYSKIVLLRKAINFTHRLIFRHNNKNKYDFSCCYATYDLTCNKLSKIASKNSSMYVHSDYTKLYSYRLFKKFYDARKMEQFKTLIFVSNESKDNFLNYYPGLKDRSVVVNNFIDDEEILKLSKETVKDIKKKSKILFTFVGRIDESSKKLTKLIRLVHKLHDDFDIELWIIGDGIDRPIYEKMIKKRNIDYIHMLGMKQNPYPYMVKSDYIILTSVYEGFPVIYLESILLNKKILTTIDTTDGKISIENNFGYIIPQDEEEMYEKVKSILKKDTLKYKTIDFKKLNNEKMSELEKIFNEVV